MRKWTTGLRWALSGAGGSTCPTGGTSITGQDPLLGPLQTNSPGFTSTRALGAGIPAIDAVAGGGPPPSTDQRGATRPQGSACDVGACEVLAASLPCRC